MKLYDSLKKENQNISELYTISLFYERNLLQFLDHNIDKKSNKISLKKFKKIFNLNKINKEVFDHLVEKQIITIEGRSIIGKNNALYQQYCVERRHYYKVY